eukprot:CAMPEP_0113592538 /NCGR_PEP_ID=MMETSP0015_2-20120614/37901_1 /TAXON_ID=2838 /ORGANISM="Odontella" /LENGTH=435 /DNA_ID=CAMNT_0000499083 /DNA_START=8 /DNA_END=1315 /DNA_ORIENTATION=- /assembly_acc=CAM_ASM_000160
MLEDTLSDQEILALDIDDDEAALRNCMGCHVDAEKSEDLVMAKEESDIHTFVPPSLLEPKETIGPKIVLLSRDVPAHAKIELLVRLNRDLPGKFVRVSATENMGLCAQTYQNVLDLGHIVVTDVDMGVGQSTRSLFLHGFAICKQVLLPKPSCACVVGSAENKSDTRPDFGTSEGDRSAMRDGELKCFSESANHLMEAMQESSLREEMKLLGRCDQPPKSYTLIMEAVVVLLSPSGKFRNPRKVVNTVSWLGTRRILAEAERLQHSLKAVDICNIPDINLSVLCSYLRHDNWPNNHGFAEGHEVMQLLSNWISSVVTFAMRLKESGGLPDPSCLEEPGGLFAVSSKVLDAGLDMEGLHSADQGYKRVLNCLLQDAVVRCDTVELSGTSIAYRVSACLGYGKAFFFVSESTTNRVVCTKALMLSKIDSLNESCGLH